MAATLAAALSVCAPASFVDLENVHTLANETDIHGNIAIARVMAFDTEATKKVKKGDKKKGERNKATGDGDRVLRTTETAAYLAKNRIGLDPTIPFDDQTYSVIQAARKRCLTSDAELATQLETLLVGASDPDATRAWFKAQANKSAAIEALRKRAASAAAKETAQ